MTANTATSAGATQVVTINADSAPMTATPPKVPADWRLESSESHVCAAVGICSVKRPNIASPRAMSTAAKSAMIQGCWNIACACWPCPKAAKAAPATVYVSAIPST